MDITSIQEQLFKRGFNPGEIDGVWGRRTIAAVRSFQQVHGLEVDGIIGPMTMRALFGIVGDAAVDGSEERRPPLVWFEEATRLIGTREKPGTRDSNPDIVHWAKDLDIDYKGDDIPWCGLFVAHCIGATLPEEQLPAGPLMARNWRRFGEKCNPQRGAILVFWRGKTDDGSSGHVGFYRSEDEGAFHILGGNQNDSVNVTAVARGRLLAARWPRTAAHLTGAVLVAERNGSLAHKET